VVSTVAARFHSTLATALVWACLQRWVLHCCDKYSVP